MNIDDQCCLRITNDHRLIRINDDDVCDHDAWLPLTESRNGDVYSSSFHLICSGIGFQALLLPLGFVSLGWAWGVTCLSIAFSWQLYTIWLLVHLHESQQQQQYPGTRYSRYLHLAVSSFGAKLGKVVCIFPVMYLSGGACVMLIITGGGALNLFLQTVLSGGDQPSPLNGVICFLLFTSVAIAVSQLPNLNSIAAVSLVGAITAVAYCALILIFSIDKGRPQGVSYDPWPTSLSKGERICEVLNGIGIIALAFRGHNIILEIQGTIMSSTSPKYTSKAAMWKGVTISYIIIAACIYPIAIAGYWAYGNKMPTNGGGLLSAFSEFHGQTTSKFIRCTIYLLFLINCITTFPIFAMPVFDNLESVYTRKNNTWCPTWLRRCIRVLFGGFAFFIATAFPFLGKLSGLIGGMALPLTFAYPCFMWIAMKRPSKYGAMWVFNVGLGCLGLVLTVVCVSAAIWNLVNKGLHANFFSP